MPQSSYLYLPTLRSSFPKPKTYSDDVDSVVDFGVLPLHVALMTEIAFSILLICNIISLSSDGVYPDSTEED